MIAPYETVTDQGIGRPQQPHHYAHRIPEKTAVARVMQQRSGDRAVQPDDLAGFDFRLTRAGQQDEIDRFPRLGPDGAGRLLQHRLLRGPRQRQTGEGDQARFCSLRQSPTDPSARAPKRRGTAPDGPRAHNRRPPPARVGSDQLSKDENVCSCGKGNQIRPENATTTRTRS